MAETIGPMPAQMDQQQFARQLVDRARAEGVELVRPDGALSGLTKTVLETALEAEMSEHLGYAHPLVAVIRSGPPDAFDLGGPWRRCPEWIQPMDGSEDWSKPLRRPPKATACGSAR